METKSLIRTLMEGQVLSEPEAESAMNALMSGAMTPAQIASILTALRVRGETSDEIAGFARAMRQHAQQIHPQKEGLLDTCGTGGDTLKTWNLSTATAFVAAAAGVPVAKHGNRAVTSACGSADVLEACGVNLAMSPEQVQEAIERLGIGFLFAPQHHPAMKYAAPVRKELGARTVFNLLGPLTNPAGAKRQLLGVFDWKWLVPMAEALGKLGAEHALVVHGMDGLDEVSPVGTTVAAHLKPDGTIETLEWTPEDLGLKRLLPGEIKAGESVEESAALFRDALSGNHEALSRSLLPNAAAALWVAGRVEELSEGVWLAQRAIESGRALELLEQYTEFSHR
ncbi:MAG: anthranilate phosphoribosyltransferase [Fimbriimonadia bacterium]|nr:anthranilate phosphoribosyltransferase [Fimbriimonadia bacterium]